MKNIKWIKITMITLFMSGSLGVVAMAQQKPSPPAERQQRIHQDGQRGSSMTGERAFQRKGIEAMAPGQVWMRGLSEEQREQIKTLRFQAHKQALGLQNQLKEKNARLQTLSTGDQINARGAHSTIEEISKLEADLKKLRWDTRMEIRTLLTDEQKVVFDSFHSRQNERGQRGQMSPQGRQGQRGQMGPQGRQGRHGSKNGRGPNGQ